MLPIIFDPPTDRRGLSRFTLHNIYYITKHSIEHCLEKEEETLLVVMMMMLLLQVNVLYLSIYTAFFLHPQWTLNY